MSATGAPAEATAARPTPGSIDRFDLDGNPTKFPGTGSTSLPVPVGYYGGPGYNPDKLAIDNSGTATQGNIYLSSEQFGVYGFNPDGLPINANFPLNRRGSAGSRRRPTAGSGSTNTSKS